MSERLLRTVLVVLVLCLVVPGLQILAGEPEKVPENVAQTSWLDNLPPLIDRELLFGDPEISGAQISPDGQWISFRKSYKDVMNLWVKGVNQPFASAIPITADTERPVRGYFWSRDSHYVLYVQDKGGNENFHVYAVDPAAEAGEDGVPVARDLTPVEGVRATIVSLPKHTPGTMLIGLNDRDASLHDIYSLEIATGERTLVLENTFGAAGFLTDLKGKVRLGFKLNDEGGSDIFLLAEKEQGETIFSCTFEETCLPVRFHKDGKHVYMQSNKGEGVDLTQLVLYDLADGSTELIEKDPEGQVDFGSAIFSDVTDELIATAYVGDRVRIYPRNKRLKRDLDLLEKKLPGREIGISSATSDERYWVLGASSDVNPGAAYLYDRKKRKLNKLYDSRPELPSERLANMQPVRYPARDGVEIPAYLTLPRGAEGKPVPALLLVHGGPWARDKWGYNSFAQFLANRGYAVLQPNFRGSTGYGKKFLNDGNNGWGTGIMQHDLSDAVKYLVDSGIATPNQVGIMGGSYGGYATLAGLAFTPDLYAVGVDIVGPSNIITLLDSIPAYWAPIRKLFDKRLGDPKDPEDHKRMIAQSPLFKAKRIKAPLFVIQGANDPRVKQREADQIVVALRDLDRGVEYMVAPDEGHGFAGEQNRLAMFAAIERFLALHLGGRYQTQIDADLTKHLEGLMVDPASVVLPEENQGADKARTAALPVPVEGLVVALEQTFAGSVNLPGGQQLETQTQRVVTAIEDGSAWKVEATSSGPMGDGTDTFVLDAKTLQPRSRKVQQGPISVDMTYSAGKIEGEIKTPGGAMPVDQALDAPVFGDDAALGTVFAGLALEEGFATTLRTFDLQSQKVRIWSLSVEGLEKRTTAAGEFNCYRLLYSALDDAGGGGTFWVALDPRMVVAYELAVPTQRGEVKVSGELSSFTLR